MTRQTLDNYEVRPVSIGGEAYPRSNFPVKAYPIKLNLPEEQQEFNRSSSFKASFGPAVRKV